jgi:hypothetical protein
MFYVGIIVCCVVVDIFGEFDVTGKQFLLLRIVLDICGVFFVFINVGGNL